MLAEFDVAPSISGSSTRTGASSLRVRGMVASNDGGGRTPRRRRTRRHDVTTQRPRPLTFTGCLRTLRMPLTSGGSRGSSCPHAASAVAIAIASSTSLLVGGLGIPPAAAVAHGTPAAAGPVPVRRQADDDGHPPHRRDDVRQRLLGALISPTWIITAGPLLPRRQPQPGQRAGPLSDDGDAEHREPGDVSRARRGRWSRCGSPAPTTSPLARLSAPVTDVRPLALSIAPTAAAGQLLTLAGWGATSSVNPTPSNQLITGVVKIWSVAVQHGSGARLLPRRRHQRLPLRLGRAVLRARRPARAPRLTSVESTGPNCPHTPVGDDGARRRPRPAGSRTVVPDLPAAWRQPFGLSLPRPSRTFTDTSIGVPSKPHRSRSLRSRNRR